MAAGGLTKFIHGTRQGTNATSRKIPQKLVLEDANKVYKYTSTEPSDTSTRRGAFSTDLGSYPDTSLDDIQDQERESEPPRPASNPLERHERSLAFQGSGKTTRSGTVATTQQEARSNHGHGAEDTTPLNRQDAAISALIGADNVQEYEEFLQTWTTGGEDSENLSRSKPQIEPIVLGTRRPKVREPSAPPATSHSILPVQVFTQKLSGSTPAQLEQSSGKDNAIRDDRPRDLLLQPLRRPPASTIFQSQAAPIANGITNQLSSSHSQPPITEVSSVKYVTSGHAKPRSHQHDISVQPSNEHSVPDRWSLKRSPNLDSVKLDMSEQQLLSIQYSSLDEDDGQSGRKDSAAFFDDLEQVITGIVNQISDEETLLSHLSQLGHDDWAALGDKIHSKQGELVNELKKLYTKKQDISALYQQETRDMMRQIDNNDQIVTTKLQRLRSLGAQILNGKGPTE